MTAEELYNQTRERALSEGYFMPAWASLSDAERAGFGRLLEQNKQARERARAKADQAPATASPVTSKTSKRTVI